MNKWLTKENKWRMNEGWIMNIKKQWQKWQSTKWMDNDKQWMFRVECMMKHYEQPMSKWQTAMKSWMKCYEWCNMKMNGW